jgi:tetratricopeptide (TPR) repeat protein
MRGRRILHMGGLGLASILYALPAFAGWDFVPTPLEWETWPVYCRVQYASVNNGLDYKNSPVYSPTEVARWRETLGEQTFDRLHHYCASMHFLNRARVDPDRTSRNFKLNRAWEDAEFTFTRAESSSPIYPLLGITAAQVRFEMGKADEAEDILKGVIKALPARPEAYVTLAILYRKQHETQQALNTLAEANTATGGESAEIQYNLGLLNLEMGNVSSAVQNASKAYSMGYPLPGLKNKLQASGHWEDVRKAMTDKQPTPMITTNDDKR